jgi:hypothetical protein
MTSSRRLLRIAAATAGVLALLFLLLAIPAAAPVAPEAPAGTKAFRWGRDAQWAELEAAFARERSKPCADSAVSSASITALRVMIADLQRTPVSPTAPALDSVESRFFALAPGVAACGPLVERYVDAYARMREMVKWQSREWEVNASATRDRLYRALYGGRAAVEEVMLQQPGGIDALLAGIDEPSAAPAATSHGVELRSGDIIVSRGGYPTSALIARGNDYPGNFSHVALVYIDSATHAISVIEAHIELGVAISSFDKYLSDKKLRLMLLRPRADLAALRADPLLPHRAAAAMYARARSGHIPYDFAMDYRDPSRLFCSEVASSAYHVQGVELWNGISTISSPGLRRWLASFGVSHFETEEPSDIEYDPQLVVVAEWRDMDALFSDHIDNAVTDVMLEGAERGDALTFAWYKLPPARIAKAYSWVLEQGGRVGPMPEGMSASSALRNRAYSERHAMLAARVRESAAAWATAHGYRPAYWTLVELARKAE